MSVISSIFQPRQARPAGTALAQAARRLAQEQPPQDRVTLSEEARRYQLPDERRHWGVPTDNSERTPQIQQRQEANVRRALQGGQCMDWTNANGQREAVSIRATENGAYQLQGQDGHPVRIQLDPGMSEAERVTALARIADFHTQTPNHLRNALDQIEVSRDQNGGILAQQGDRTMRFFGGLDNLTEHVFDHEFGHAVGRKLNRDAQSRWLAEHPYMAYMPDNNFSATPRGWDEAREKDILAPSQYARQGSSPEDFAEAYAAYREAQEAGPQAMAQLRQQFPERTRYLDTVMNQG
jgi:hypothetical protein